MEDVLSVYQLPYAPDIPVICMDESNKQLIGEVREPIGIGPGRIKRIDDEYVRNGVAQIFLEVEPLTGKRHVEIREFRGKKDWALFIKGMLDERYPQAQKVRLIVDNLNTHAIASLYATFLPEEAYRLASRLELHYTPKHGSWLNIAEIELSVLKRQCLDRRISEIEVMQKEVKEWEEKRNNQIKKIDWQFTSEEARVKLRKLYPKL